MGVGINGGSIGGEGLIGGCCMVSAFQAAAGTKSEAVVADGGCGGGWVEVGGTGQTGQTQ